MDIILKKTMGAKKVKEVKPDRIHHDGEIFIYTDGSCNNKTNQNGGFGIVLLYNGNEKRVYSNQYSNTTSARMEIRGLLESLKHIRDKTIPVTVYCDNEYVCKSISEKWAEKWENESWLIGRGEDNLKYRLNHDLWKQVLEEYRKFPAGNVKLVWVRGHDGDKYNEIADELAGIAAHSSIIIDDTYTNNFH